MLNTIQSRTQNVGGTVFAASRQVWLAGLGAAVVTREWAEREGGNFVRNLIKEGTAVESRAFHLVGNQVESSVTRANVLWRKTRSSVETTVRAYADTAVTLVRKTLPKSLPAIELPAMLKASPAAKPKGTRAKRAVKTRARKAARGTKRAAKARG